MASNLKSTVFGKVEAVDNGISEGDVSIKKNGSTELILDLEEIFKDQYGNIFSIGRHSIDSEDYPDGIELTKFVVPVAVGGLLIQNNSSQTINYEYNPDSPVNILSGSQVLINPFINGANYVINIPTGTKLTVTYYDTNGNIINTSTTTNPPSTGDAGSLSSDYAYVAIVTDPI